MLACQANNFQIVRVLCNQASIDIDAKDDLEYTALTITTILDESNIVRFLLERGANPNTRNTQSGCTPLMEAADRRCEAAFRELLPYSDLTCATDAYRTATWFIMNSNRDNQKAQFRDHVSRLYQRNSSDGFLDAVIQWFDEALGPLRLAEMFLEFDVNKLNINEVDIDGLTPLMVLAGKDDALRVRRLLELGADLKYQSSETGSSAFHEAAKLGSFRALRELLDFAQGDCILDAVNLDHMTPLSYATCNILGQKKQVICYHMVQMLLEEGADVNATTLKHRQTPLMFAAHQGWDKVVGLLLKYGANVSSQNTEYATPLSLAVQSGDIATVRRLLDAKASHHIKDKSGATPLILAAKHGHLDLVRLFFSKYHSSMKDKDRSGRTALSYAAGSNHLPIVQYLLRNRPDSEADMLDIRDRQDQTALVWACKAGNYTILHVLMENGATFRLKDRNKRMPFSHAAEMGWTPTIRLLLEKEKAEQMSEVVNWQDTSGRTALSWAAEEGHTDVVRQLLDSGADASLTDSKKQTPRIWALDKGHTKVVNLLDRHESQRSDGESDDASSDVFFDCELIPPT